MIKWEAIEWMFDKAMVIYNRLPGDISEKDMAEHRMEICEAMVGQWKEECFGK